MTLSCPSWRSALGMLDHLDHVEGLEDPCAIRSLTADLRISISSVWIGISERQTTSENGDRSIGKPMI
jgi:hypothetical protein